MEIPDFDIATQGEDIADAMAMARDAIQIMGTDMKQDGKPSPRRNWRRSCRKFQKVNVLRFRGMPVWYALFLDIMIEGYHKIEVVLSAKYIF